MRMPNIMYNLLLLTLGVSRGPMVLFYGCWGPEEQIYQEEMENAISENVLTSYHVAYSRMADSPKVQQSASVVSNTHRIVIIDC